MSNKSSKPTNGRFYIFSSKEAARMFKDIEGPSVGEIIAFKLGFVSDKIWNCDKNELLTSITPNLHQNIFIRKETLNGIDTSDKYGARRENDSKFQHYKKGYANCKDWEFEFDVYCDHARNIEGKFKKLMQTHKEKIFDETDIKKPKVLEKYKKFKYIKDNDPETHPIELTIIKISGVRELVSAIIDKSADISAKKLLSGRSQI